MSLTQILAAFAADNKLAIVAFVIAADIIFGVGAALKRGTFAFSYFADFLRTDVLGKVFPWFGLYALDKASGGADLVIPGLDTGALAGVAYAALMIALVGSITSSLTDLGIPIPIAALSRNEKTVPVVVTPVTPPPPVV